MITIIDNIEIKKTGLVFTTTEQWKVKTVYFLFIPIYKTKKLLSRERKN